MARKKPYLLTPTARRHLREAKAWPLRRWGPELTEAYFMELDEVAERLAKDYRAFRPREELAGGTGLLLHPIREHYLVYEPLGKGQIAIVAVLRQTRDIPAILSKGQYLIGRELNALRESLEKTE